MRSWIVLACLVCVRPLWAGIDYSVWELQEPDGSGTSPNVVSTAQLVSGYSDAYFYLTQTGQAFMDPATGITTSGSLHPRCELREMASGAPAAWSPTGSNTLAVSGEVLQLGGGSSGKTTVGQVFNSTASIPLCELIYSASLGGFEVLYEQSKGAGTYVNLNVPVGLDTPYSFVLALSNGALSVTLNGSVVYTATPSAATLSDSFYFKCGDYDQTAVAGAVTTTAYTIVEDDAIVVTHAAATPSATASPQVSESSTPPGTGTPTPTTVATSPPGATSTPSSSPTSVPDPSLSPTLIPGFSATATPYPSATFTGTPTVLPQATATAAASMLPTNTASPTPAVSQPPTVSASATPSASATGTASATAQPSPSATASSTPTGTPAVSPSATEAPVADPSPTVSGGSLGVVRFFGVPNPNPVRLAFLLSGPAESLQVRVYNVALVRVRSWDFVGPYPAGWATVSLPPGVPLPNGLYYALAVARRDAAVAPPSRTRLFLLR